jgi:hypothetical protein
MDPDFFPFHIKPKSKPKSWTGIDLFKDSVD